MLESVGTSRHHCSPCIVLTSCSDQRAWLTFSWRVKSCRSPRPPFSAAVCIIRKKPHASVLEQKCSECSHKWRQSWLITAAVDNSFTLPDFTVTSWRRMGECRYSSTTLVHCTRWRWAASFTRRRVYPPAKEPPEFIGYETGWAPEPAWRLWRRHTSLAPSGNPTPARPVRSPSLYRVSYSVSWSLCICLDIQINVKLLQALFLAHSMSKTSVKVRHRQILT
jgi:hypothetical protein